MEMHTKLHGYELDSLSWRSLRLALRNTHPPMITGQASHAYSRLFHIVAVAVMLQAIYVLVPIGLAVSGGLSVRIGVLSGTVGRDSTMLIQ